MTKMNELTKTIWFDENSQPSKDKIWYRGGGKFYEYKNGKWVVCYDISEEGAGISSNMTEDEKAELRKNLGLYYEETATGEKEVQYNNEPESATLSGYAKISDDTPAKEDIIAVQAAFGSGEVVFDDTSDDDGFGVGVISAGEPFRNLFIIITDNSAGHELGIYVQLSTVQVIQQKLVYNGETTVVSKIDEKFLKNVLLTTEQELTAEQKAQVKTNLDISEGGGSGGGAVKEIESSFVDAESVNLTEQYGITEEEFAQMLSGQIAFVKSNEILYSVITASISSPFKVLVLAKPNQFKEPQYIVITGSVTSCNIVTVGTELFAMATPQSDTDLTDEQFYVALGITAAQFTSIAQGRVRSISFLLSGTYRVDIYGSDILSLGGGKIYAVKDANGWQLTVS